jgi:hypothetical protein
MTILLVLMTAAATLAAVSLGLLLLGARRDERRRSEARVAALTLAAGGPFDSNANDAGEPTAFDAPIFAGPPEPATGLLASADLFEAHDSVSPWRARLGIAAALAVAFAGLVLGAVAASQGGTRPAQEASAPAAAPAPLSLADLRYSRAGGVVTVSGSVEAAGGPPSGVSAAVSLFDAAGQLVAGGRAPLQPARLDAGARASFSVSVPVAAAVARYRVSFVDPAGRTIPHVDGRTGPALARRN